MVIQESRSTVVKGAIRSYWRSYAETVLYKGGRDEIASSLLLALALVRLAGAAAQRLEVV